MADDSDEERQNLRAHQNQPYDESLDVPDAEEVASLYTPTPRVAPIRAGGRLKDPGRGRSRGDTPPEPKMSDQSDDEFDTEDDVQMHAEAPPGRPPQGQPQPLQRVGAPPQDKMFGDDDDDDDDDDDEDGSDESDDDSQGALEGAYDPTEFDHLAVTPDIKELFQYITRYTPQSIELDNKLKPFIPDFIPAVGDIDAFIKVGRPDSKPDNLGLIMLDEPCAQQSDPTVLALKLRECFPSAHPKELVVKSIEDADKNPKAIQNWIQNIRELHRTKPPPNVHYTKNMPDVENLMQEWPSEFEEMLKEVGLPTADVDCDLSTYVDMICALLDIPVYKSKVQSLHVLFTLFSEFKNSQHFRALAEDNKMDNSVKGGPPVDDSDRLIL